MGRITRRKADGQAFERDFNSTMGERYYVRRLPTPGIRYAGISQPADFILIGNFFNYVEVKETAGDRFQLSGLQQENEIRTFIQEKEKLKKNKLKCEVQYWLVVNFLKKGIVAIQGETAIDLIDNRKTLQPDEWELFPSLTELREEGLF